MTRRLAWLIAALAASSGAEQPPGRAGGPCVNGADRTMFATAEATGGQAYLLDRSEIGRSAEVIIARMGHELLLARAAGDSDIDHEFAFPVDSTVTSLVVSVWVQCRASIEILPPAAATADSRHRFLAGEVARFPAPAPGMWRVRARGRGLWSISAEGKGDLDIESARFVRWGGRPGHEGWFPMTTPPPAGSTGTLQVELSEEVSEVRFSLVAANSAPLAGLFDDTRFEHSPAAHFLRIQLPTGAFRLLVEGVDINGYPFRRLTGAAFLIPQAQPVR
ncbi:MAG: hypothetical protein R2729_32695 [Bryobacteraceae bacterium]